MKKKKIYNSKTIRISLGDYALLSGISQRLNLTMSEALHKLILGLKPKAEKPEPEGAPTPVAKAWIPKPAFQCTPVTVMAVNGAGGQHSAYLIKTKGVQYG